MPALASMPRKIVLLEIPNAIVLLHKGVRSRIRLFRYNGSVIPPYGDDAVMRNGQDLPVKSSAKESRARIRATLLRCGRMTAFSSQPWNRGGVKSMILSFSWPELPGALHECEPWGMPGIEPPLREVLADPLVQAVMRRDGVSRAELESVVAHAQRRLRQRHDSRSGFNRAPESRAEGIL
jgi:hypothetical protein